MGNYHATSNNITHFQETHMKQSLYLFLSLLFMSCITINALDTQQEPIKPLSFYEGQDRCTEIKINPEGTLVCASFHRDQTQEAYIRVVNEKNEEKFTTDCSLVKYLNSSFLFHPKQPLLFVKRSDDILSIFNTNTFKLLSSHLWINHLIKFSPLGNFLISEQKTKAEVHSFAPKTNGLTCINSFDAVPSFSPDEQCYTLRSHKTDWHTTVYRTNEIDLPEKDIQEFLSPVPMHICLLNNLRILAGFPSFQHQNAASILDPIANKSLDAGDEIHVPFKIHHDDYIKLIVHENRKEIQEKLAEVYKKLKSEGATLILNEEAFFNQSFDKIILSIKHNEKTLLTLCDLTPSPVKIKHKEIEQRPDYIYLFKKIYFNNHYILAIQKENNYQFAHIYTTNLDHLLTIPFYEIKINHDIFLSPDFIRFAYIPRDKTETTKTIIKLLILASKIEK